MKQGYITNLDEIQNKQIKSLDIEQYPYYVTLIYFVPLSSETVISWQMDDLKNLHIIDLGYCIRLTDVWALGNLKNIHKLDLGYCNRLTDVSALVNIPTLHTLKLSDCDQLSWR